MLTAELKDVYKNVQRALLLNDINALETILAATDDEEVEAMLHNPVPGRRLLV